MFHNVRVKYKVMQFLNDRLLKNDDMISSRDSPCLKSAQINKMLLSAEKRSGSNELTMVRSVVCVV